MLEGQQITLFGALTAGLLSFLSPCVLPLIPSYITYISGLSFAELQTDHPQGSNRIRASLHALAFIAGFTTIFILLGASATYLGSFVQEYSVLLRKVGGILITIFGIHVTGLVPLKFLLGERRVTVHTKPAGYLGSFMVGITFAAGWTPCIGPILASILMIAATGEKVQEGIMLLLAYSVGMGIPFFLSALAMNRFIRVFNRFKKHIRMFEITTGLFLILVGIMLFTDLFSRLSSYANIMFGGIR